MFLATPPYGCVGMINVIQNLPPHVLGWVAFVLLHKYQRNKLSPRTLCCVFLGYAANKKGYQCYHPPTQKMFITLDVFFHEDSIYFSYELEVSLWTRTRHLTTILLNQLDYKDRVCCKFCLVFELLGEMQNARIQKCLKDVSQWATQSWIYIKYIYLYCEHALLCFPLVPHA